MASDFAEGGVPLAEAPATHQAAARVAHADASPAYIATTTHTSAGTVHK
ncbi:hypothetical protein GCM10023148_14520 [Actinokineospora soli]